MSLYGNYSPQQYQQGVNSSLSNSLFGRRNSLLDSTPYISQPQGPDWRQKAIQNFLPNYQNLNNSFRESFGRPAADQFPHSPYQSAEAFPNRPDAQGFNAFTPQASGGAPPFPMHPMAPPPVDPNFTQPQPEPAPVAPAAPPFTPPQFFEQNGRLVSPGQAWQAIQGWNNVPYSQYPKGSPEFYARIQQLLSMSGGGFDDPSGGPGAPGAGDAADDPDEGDTGGPI